MTATATETMLTDTLAARGWVETTHCGFAAIAIADWCIYVSPKGKGFVRVLMPRTGGIPISAEHYTTVEDAARGI